MAEIKPFRALRFSQNAGDIAELTCPPYDIISEEERLAFIGTNEHNIIRLELPRGEQPYEEAASILDAWLADGTLVRDDQDAIYIYEEDFTARGEQKSIRGIICRVKLEEFSKGVVLPHEETLSKAKTDRFNLMCATNCNFSQIYSLYMDEERATTSIIDDLADGTPDVEMTDAAGVVHKLWVVTYPPVVERICATFADRKLYIADGHHRYETGLNYRNHMRESGKANEGDACDYIMMMLVDMENDGLVVFPTHRLVRDLEEFDREKLLAAVSDNFEVSHHTGVAAIEPALDALYAEGKKAFALYCGNDEWDLLVLRDIAVMQSVLPECSEALRGLDVSVLHSLVLERAMGIDKANMAAQINLTYTRVFEEAIGAVDTGAAQCSFILNPTRVTEIRDVAAAGEKMPQKSTYFYPKLITGLVMNQLED